jgi:hypothetical protein
MVKKASFRVDEGDATSDPAAHRGPFLLRPYLLGTYNDPRNLKLARVPTYCPQFSDSVFPQGSEHAALAIPPEPFEIPGCLATLLVW